MIDQNDELFEEQILRELDLRAAGDIDNAADVLGVPVLTVEEDVEANDA